MKYSFISMLSACALLTLSSCSCSSKPSADTSADSTMVADSTVEEPIEEDSELILDSLTVKKKTRYEYTTTVVFAKGANTTLVNSINEWVNEVFGGTYRGDVTDAKAMIAYYQRRWMKEEEPDAADYASNVHKVWVEYETPQFVTLRFMSDVISINRGDFEAHAATFRKKDGRKFDYTMLPKEHKMQSILLKGVSKSIETSSDEVKYYIEEEGKDPNFIPYPEMEPFLSKKGLILSYQSHELFHARYGTPTVVVPYSQLKSLLNTTGRTYLP